MHYHVMITYVRSAANYSRKNQHYAEGTLNVSSHFLLISLPGSCNKLFKHMPPNLHDQKINKLFNVGPSRSPIFHF